MAYNPETLSFELPDTDMVYVTGLPTNVTIEEVAEHFGSIGVVKFDKKKNQKKVSSSPQATTITRKLLPPAACHTSCLRCSPPPLWWQLCITAAPAIESQCGSPCPAGVAVQGQGHWSAER